ncbi:MAG: 4Fe-4S binding protein [Prevotellaceae bacterium]|jgi:polyferredoxin|nr:4Fe-4S binding protein [Prevotellaceae bacterium]
MATKKSFLTLKTLRVVLAVCFFTLITFFFIDFADFLPIQFHRLAHLQFIPAIFWGSFVILAFLIVLTLLFGRIYCSVICPMGVFQDIVAWLSKKINKRKKYFFSYPKNILRTCLLGIFIISFFASINLIVSLIEPYSAFGRMAAHIFKPVYQFGNNVLEQIFTSFGNYTFYRTEIFFDLTSFLVAIITFFTIGFFAYKNGRTFCNTVCPTGTVLGFLSKFSLFKVRIDGEKCNHCGSCGTKCKASCINSKEGKIDYGRCVDCFDCIGVCNKNALKFLPLKTTNSQSKKINSDRRKFLTTSLFTAVSMPLLLAQSKGILKPDVRARKIPLSPPGSLSADNLQKHCTACHLCIGKCPSNVLKPAFLEYGLAGMMQPVMSFENGFCNYNCTQCSNVCPNGALRPLTVEQKHTTQMGKVQFNRDICVVVRNGKNCGACSEHCPTQAVKMMPYKDGLTIPQIDTTICIGCGGCEFICPVRPARAIFVEGNRVHQKATVKLEEKAQKVTIDDFGF